MLGAGPNILLITLNQDSYKYFFSQDVQGFMLQLLEALSFAHDRHIAHLDIKVCTPVLTSSTATTRR